MVGPSGPINMIAPAVEGGVAMMSVKLPGGREIRAPWSNLAPCGMISERLAEILQLQQDACKKSFCRAPQCWPPRARWPFGLQAPQIRY